jgi:glucose/arabinose dehydrogenase
MCFHEHGRFRKPHHDAIFIAEHGSWNRSSKLRYRVVVAHVGKNDMVVGFKPLLTGFRDARGSWELRSTSSRRTGCLLVSDDDKLHGGTHTAK